MQAVKGTGEWFPVELVALDTGIGIEGLAHDAVGLEISYQKPGAAVVVFTPTALQWREGHLGTYQVFLPDAVISDVGVLMYWATYTDALAYAGVVDVYAVDPAYGTITATYLQGIRARGISVTDISDSDLTAIIGEALFEYSRYRPIIADLTFDTVADQQKYTWTQAGDAAGLSIIACLWNPSGALDVWDSQCWLVSHGLDLIGGEWHWPSLDVIEDIKQAAWRIDNTGTGFQNDGEGGDIWLSPTPSEAGCTVFLLYAKPHSSTTTIKASDRDAFLDLVESLCAGWIGNAVSKASSASDIKTPEYEVKGNSTYKYWMTRGSEVRQRFIDKCNAGMAAVART